MSLKPFREVPKDMVEWTRWFNQQDTSSTTNVTSSSSGQQFTNYSITHAIADVSSNSATCQYSAAQSWFVDLEAATGVVTIILQGSPSGYGEINIRVKQGSVARTITWSGGAFEWPGGTVPTMTTANDSIDIYHFQTIDGGVTWTGSALQNVS